MLSLQRVAETWPPIISVLTTAIGLISMVKGLWKLVRFLGLCRLFRRCLSAANAHLGIVSPLGVMTERERRFIEGRTSASDRAGPPMIF